MKKKTSTQNINANDIELPLLTSKVHENDSVQESKSPFMNFIRSDPSKYIEKLSFFRFITLSDIWPLLKLANTKQGTLNINDLPKPFAFCNIENKIIALDAAWTESVKQNKPSFTRAILKAYKREIILSLLFGYLLALSLLLSS